MSNIGIALQLYTLRDAAAHDLPGTLRRCREAGFAYVQWSGMPELPAAAIREQLDAASLKAIAAHASLEAFERDFERETAFWNTVGAPDIAIGGMMEGCVGPLDAWLRGAARLDALGERLRAVGMRLSYHNHDRELEPLAGDGRRPLDILFESTSARNVYAEFDTAWLAVGGVDPAEYIRRFPGRCPVIHVKDIAAIPNLGERPVFTPLGQGSLDWGAIFDAAEEVGAEWYVYEQDTCAGDSFEAARISYEFLAEHA